MYFFLKEPSAKNATPIYLIYFVKLQNKNFKFSTGQKIEPKNWNSETRMPVIKRGIGAVELKHITLLLNKYAEFLEEIIRDSERSNYPLTRDILKSKFDEKFRHKIDNNIDGLVSIYDEFIKTKNKSGGKGKSWNKQYTLVKRKLIEFEKEKHKKIEIADITQDWLEEFGGYLRTINVNGFKPQNDNSLRRTIGYLLTVLLWSANKFPKLDIKKLKNHVTNYQPDDVHLSSSEVTLLEGLKLNTSILDKTRDLFLIGVYSGQRFSDYSVFEKADITGNMIIKKAEKTEKESYIPLHPKLKNLLEKYNYNLPKISSVYFNMKIKEIFKIAGVNEEVKEIIYRGTTKEIIYHPKYKMISSHTARRTFITLSSERGMPDHIIMKITGIKNPNTLLKYKKTSQKTVEELMLKIWE